MMTDDIKANLHFINYFIILFSVSICCVSGNLIVTFFYDMTYK